MRVNLRLKPHLTAPHICPHAPVAYEAVEGVFEGGGAVVFEEEMADPCECVALQQSIEDEHGVAGDYGHDNQHKADAGADEVQTAASAIAVLAQVKRVKLGKAAEAFFCCAIAHVASS